MSTTGNTEDITVPDGDGGEIIIGYIEEGECDHCGEYWYAYAFRDFEELHSYQIDTCDNREDAEAVVRAEYERLGPFPEEFEDEDE